MRPADESSLCLWCFLDGKPGHQNQTLGLVDALRRCGTSPPVVLEWPVPTRFPGRLIGPSWRQHHALPAPHLMIGAGHATHIPILRARHRFGGRSVVLMKPSLPISLFDLCVIPDAHDIKPGHRHIFMTRGVLNRVQPSHRQEPTRAMILVGGPSHHFQWVDADVIEQLRQVILRSPGLEWTIATSRRTPASFLESWRSRNLPGRLVPHDAVARDWLPQQIQSCRTIWVTEDSVSMTYEAVTSGADVGSIELGRPRRTRVTLGMDRLVQGGCVTPWSQWNQTGQLRRGQLLRSEADRTAEEILKRFCPQFLSTPASAA